MSNDKFYPGFNDENLDRDKKLKDGLDGGPAKDDLIYNADSDSFEIDVKSDDPDYDHPSQFDTAAAASNGADFNSTYDEANPYDTAGEYDADRSLETDASELGMHIDEGKIVELDPLDEEIARTPEDDREDLDEEGYPKNDADLNTDSNEYLK
jgi:hypothetical protein